MISQALQNAQSIEQVVEIINGGGTSEYSANEIAGQYAFNAADESGYDIDGASLDAHLEVIIDAGAKFDYSSALKEAKEWSAEAE